MGRNNTNSFALLQTGDNDDKEEEEDTAMTDATEESGGGKPTEETVPAFFCPRKSYKAKTVAIEDLSP